MSTITAYDQRFIGRPTHSQSSSVRLTRRGKLVIFTGALAVIAVLVLVLGSSTVASGTSAAPQGDDHVTMTVKPGHTLWQIAVDANPNGDIRQTVADIMRLNSLPSASALQMGSTIAVPVYS